MAKKCNVKIEGSENKAQGEKSKDCGCGCEKKSQAKNARAEYSDKSSGENCK